MLITTTATGAARHGGRIRGEIVTLAEYLLGRLSGWYLPSHPSWYRRRKTYGTKPLGDVNKHVTTGIGGHYCTQVNVPSSLGQHTAVATFAGDSEHESSSATRTITVAESLG